MIVDVRVAFGAFILFFILSALIVGLFLDASLLSGMINGQSGQQAVQAANGLRAIGFFIALIIGIIGGLYIFYRRRDKR